MTGAIEYTDCISTPTKSPEPTDVESPVMLELWGMRSTPSLLSLPGPLLPCIVAPERVLSMYHRPARSACSAYHHIYKYEKAIYIKLAH